MSKLIGFIRLSAALKLAMVFLTAGLAAMAFSYVTAKRAPAQANLETFEGVVQSAKKFTTKAKVGSSTNTSTSYELTVATKSGPPRTLTSPMDALTEPVVAKIIGKTVKLQADGNYAYVIDQGAEKILTYDYAVTKYQQGLNMLVGLAGGIAAFLGAMLLPFGLIGAFRTSRKQASKA